MGPQRRLPGAMMRRTQADPAGEEGVALVAVIGLMAVLTVVAVVGLTFANNAQRPARAHQDWNAALAAAEAGLDDYLARLNRDTAYWSTATADDPLGNDALDAEAWAAIPDSDGYYHYSVDASRAPTEGLVVVRSTGYVNGETRTIEAGFRPESFLDYVYFTDLETLEPDLDPSCTQVYWMDDDSRGCQVIRFITGDVIDGPLRTNDRIVIDGSPQFLGPVRTWRYESPTTGEYWHDHSGSSDPQFLHPEGIEGPEVHRFNLPATNEELKNKTSELEGGCLYHGPTYIHFDGTDFRVRSPLSVGADPEPNPNCYSGSVSSLASTDGTVVDMEDPSFNGVIYVESSTWNQSCNQSSHPLGLPRSNEQAAPGEYACSAGDAFVWGELEGQVTLAARRDVHFIWDTTYAGDLADGSDLLGVIADRNIKVRHPVTQWRAWAGECQMGQPWWHPCNTSENLAVSGPDLPPFPPNHAPTSTNQLWEDPDIHAALVALNGTFTVQNFYLGAGFSEDQGKLSVYGAISQKHRGAVGVGSNPPSHGYIKDYTYDFRLRHLSPPYFIPPEDAQWLIRMWAEIQDPDDLPSLPS